MKLENIEKAKDIIKALEEAKYQQEIFNETTSNGTHFYYVSIHGSKSDYINVFVNAEDEKTILKIVSATLSKRITDLTKQLEALD